MFATPLDQLLGCESRPRTEVREVALHSARPDAHELGGAVDGSTSADAGGEDIHLALRRMRREGAAYVPSPRSACRRLLSRAQHLSGAPEHLFYFERTTEASKPTPG